MQHLEQSKNADLTYLITWYTIQHLKADYLLRYKFMAYDATRFNISKLIICLGREDIQKTKHFFWLKLEKKLGFEEGEQKKVK